jgi:hypothetical protein
VKGKPLLAGSVALALASGIAGNAFPQNGELDFTMQVLDDVRDVGRVMASIEREGRAAAERPQAARSRTAPTQEGSAPEQPVNRDALEMQTDVDRDEEGEGELEDYDLEEDLEVEEDDE